MLGMFKSEHYCRERNEKMCFFIFLKKINLFHEVLLYCLDQFVIIFLFCILGIECPRGSRPGPGGIPIPAEPYGEAAFNYTKDLIIQREVNVYFKKLTIYLHQAYLKTDLYYQSKLLYGLFFWYDHLNNKSNSKESCLQFFFFFFERPKHKSVTEVYYK